MPCVSHQPKPWDKKWVPLRLIKNPLQRSLISKVRTIENVTELARTMVRISGGDPENDDEMKSQRRTLNKWRNGSNPDAKLSSITLLAAALDEDELSILAHGRVADVLERIRAKADPDSETA
jgi:hypothetical protein